LLAGAHAHACGDRDLRLPPLAPVYTGRSSRLCSTASHDAEGLVDGMDRAGVRP